MKLIRLSPFKPMADILAMLNEIRSQRYDCDFSCGHCRRSLATLRPEASLRGITDVPLFRLSDQDYCRWCARPISEDAIAKAPHEGYIKVICALVPEHSCGDRDAIQIREETAAW